MAPGLWHLAQWGARLFPGHFFLNLAHCPFHRFMDRAFLLLALAGLWPLLTIFGVKSWSDLGLVSPAGQGRRLLGGLTTGFVTLGLVALLAVAVGGRPLADFRGGARVAGVFFSAMGTAVVVAVLEEVLFRGGLFNGLRRVMWWPVALGITCLIYALVHFLQHGEVTGPVHWYSGLTLLPAMLGGFAELTALVPGFFTLALAGLLLGLAYQRTGNLYFSMGLHGGWIFWLKCYRSFTADIPGEPSWIWGTGKLIDGWAAFFVLLLSLTVVCRFRFPAQKPAMPMPA